MPAAQPTSRIGATRALARHVARGSAAGLHPAVARQATRCLVDWLGVAIAGSRHPSVRILLRYVASGGGAPQASAVGRAVRTSVALAAMVNAQAAHVLDFDDTYASDETTLHGSAPILSAAIAVGEWRHRSGHDVLVAFARGYEVGIRVARALGPAHYAAGWHVTGTAGRLGAAAAAGRLLGLSEERLAVALSLAATQAAGMKAVYGTMAKAFHAAKAAHDGVLSAVLADAGFTCTDDAIEAPRGLLDLYTPRAVPQRLRPAGGRHPLLDDGFKPYPCGSLIHAAIDAALDATVGHDLAPAAVERVEALVNPHTASVTGIALPRTGLEAKFSTQHCIAVVLARRRAPGLADFTDAAARDVTIAALRRRVRLVVQSRYAKDRASIQIHLRDGRVLQAITEHARGTSQRPLEDGELDAKFTALAEPVLGHRAARLLSLARSFDELADVRELLRLTRPTARALPKAAR